MTFPKGEVIHQDLSTAYTDTSELLSTLMSNGFSGVVELVFPRCKGAFFISSGLVVNAVVEDRMGGVMMAGEEATQQLLSFSDQEDGTLTVVRLSQTRSLEGVAPFTVPVCPFPLASVAFPFNG